MGVLDNSVDHLALAGIAEAASASSNVLDVVKQIESSDLSSAIAALQRLDKIKKAEEAFAGFQQGLEIENQKQMKMHKKKKAIKNIEAALRKAEAELVELQRSGRNTKVAKQRIYESAINNFIKEHGSSAACFRVVERHAMEVGAGGRDSVLKQVRS
jgi:hypothetical protein